MKPLSLFIIFLAIVLTTSYVHAFTRNIFPEDFLFGAATSAYQREGAVNEDSVLNTFSHSDVKLMAEMGLESFRFSITWAGRYGRGFIKPKGLLFYKNLSTSPKNMESNHTLRYIIMTILSLLKMSTEDGSTAKS
ncbi:PREDICTED: beta-glucosidase 8 isoform X2 [Camelina sativa]|nr:PREDICTED: beta-glucosidase 8 isoform X2 [Camelina sativa]